MFIFHVHSDLVLKHSFPMFFHEIMCILALAELIRQASVCNVQSEWIHQNLWVRECMCLVVTELGSSSILYYSWRNTLEINDLEPNRKVVEILAPRDIKWQNYNSLKFVTPYDHDIGVFTPIKKKRCLISGGRVTISKVWNFVRILFHCWSIVQKGIQRLNRFV